MININILSLFDGISCGHVALDRAGIKVDKYYASEIDENAIKITMKNYPDTIQLGDITQLDLSTLPQIDLLIGGSPCQGFSKAGKGLNFNDPRSKLFFVYVDVLKYLRNRNPNLHFLLENVEMKKEWEDVITEYLGVDPIHINSNLVSAQNRKRLYWTNIPNVKQPEDKHIFPKDIIENWNESQHASACNTDRYFKFKNKFSTITATYWKGIRGSGRPAVSTKEGYFDDDRSVHRMLTPIEAERLQTLPDNYTEGICKTNRYKAIGNGWTVDVISYILEKVKSSTQYIDVA